MESKKFVGVVGDVDELQTIANNLGLNMSQNDGVYSTSEWDCVVNGEDARLVFIAVSSNGDFDVDFRSYDAWTMDCKDWFEKKLTFKPDFSVKEIEEHLDESDGIIAFEKNQLVELFEYERNLAAVLDCELIEAANDLPKYGISLGNDFSRNNISGKLNNLKQLGREYSYAYYTDPKKLMKAIDFLNGCIFTVLQTKYLETVIPDQVRLEDSIVVKFGNVRIPILALIVSRFMESHGQALPYNQLAEEVESLQLCARAEVSRNLEKITDHGKDIKMLQVFCVPRDVAGEELRGDLRIIFNDIQTIFQNHNFVEVDMINYNGDRRTLLQKLRELDNGNFITTSLSPTKFAIGMIKGYRSMEMPFLTGTLRRELYRLMTSIENGDTDYDTALEGLKDYYKGVFDQFVVNIDMFGRAIIEAQE